MVPKQFLGMEIRSHFKITHCCLSEDKTSWIRQGSFETGRGWLPPTPPPKRRKVRDHHSAPREAFCLPLRMSHSLTLRCLSTASLCEKWGKPGRHMPYRCDLCWPATLLFTCAQSGCRRGNPEADLDSSANFGPTKPTLFSKALKPVSSSK